MWALECPLPNTTLRLWSPLTPLLPIYVVDITNIGEIWTWEDFVSSRPINNIPAAPYTITFDLTTYGQRLRATGAFRASFCWIAYTGVTWV